ncbi:MAG: GcvT family protein [Hyphomicrobiaceae bacterium]
MATELPGHARVVIVGGGIVGCSIAYHLTKHGWSDVVLLEQGRLSGGTTWHAAGLVGQLRSHQNMTKLIQYSTGLYSRLEEETGQATGWKKCGSLTVARTEDRMTLLKRVAVSARAQGVECELLSPSQAYEKWPLLESKDLVGAAWLPGDGKANPADITQALAKGARNGGARIAEGVRVTSFNIENARVSGVVTAHGSISADFVVIACGQWTRQLAMKAGVTVPLHSCEHMYIVTERIEGVSPDLPCLRDPDGFVYFKEEVGGLLMGGFEPKAKPWVTDVPDDFEFGMLPDDWDQFEILMKNAIERVPALERAQVKQFMNGPESFTADNNYILGEAPQVRSLFVAAGFNSTGIASAGGAGWAMADWIVSGEPQLDLWPVDIRRFAEFNSNEIWLRDRVSEVLGLHYMMPWPNRELETARPFRRSPLYDRLDAKGVIWGSKMGWERPNVFVPKGEKAEIEYGWDRQNWFDWHCDEQKAAREGVCVFDMSSFAKFLIQGDDAEVELNRICANDLAVQPGTSVYTGLLNARGGYESDVTVARLSQTEFLMLSGTAQAIRDPEWIRRNLRAGSGVSLTDVTSAYSVISVIGPRSRALLGRVSGADLGDQQFPFAAVRPINIGYARVLACRRTYVGELGWELYVPTEFAAGVYDKLFDAGTEIGLRDGGYYTIEGMRLEKGYRAWGRELTPDYNPYEAGLGFAAKLNKGCDFIGRTALLEACKQPPQQRFLSLVAVSGDSPLAHGGEAILDAGRPVGEVMSAAFGATLDRVVMLGYVDTRGEAVSDTWISERQFEVDIAGTAVPVAATVRAPLDPANNRLK